MGGEVEILRFALLLGGDEVTIGPPHQLLRDSHQAKRYAPFLIFAVDTLPATLVSSNGRHLKSFLYPPHSTFRFLHCKQVGFDSSHFNRFALQVMQPEW